jgi:hypothetical protein
MPKRVDHAPNPPTVSFGHWINYGAARRAGMCKDRVRISDRQDDPDATAVQGFRAEVTMLGRLIGDPKLRTVNR